MKLNKIVNFVPCNKYDLMSSNRSAVSFSYSQDPKICADGYLFSTNCEIPPNLRRDAALSGRFRFQSPLNDEEKRDL